MLGHPMTYLRKTVTYTVRRADGEQLFVDEFECQDHPCVRRTAAQPVSTQLLLRNGDRAEFVDDRTLELARTGEHLTIVDKE